MKLAILFRTCLIGVAFMSFIVGPAARAGTETEVKATSTRPKTTAVKPRQRVILVEVTGSRIPQRVVLYGQQANSGSPMYVIQGQELANTGATSVGGLLSLDPSVSVNTRRP